MKVEAFKKLIKESIREVLKEEGLLTENKLHFTSQQLDPKKYIMTEQIYTGSPINNNYPSTGNPLQDLLKQTMMESNDLSNYQ